MNPSTIVIILGLLALAAFVIWHQFLRKPNPMDITRRVNAIKDHRVLPSGLTLWVERGATVTQPEIDAIESGMLECFGRARAAGYDRPLTRGQYVVAILGDCIKFHGEWSFKLPAGPEYAGTQYDHDGFVYAAGQYLERDDYNMIVLPEHKGEDLEELKTVADNEIQHCILRYCNPVEYLRTKYHTPQTAHPLF